jgi:uncharacterized protein YxeA
MIIMMMIMIMMIIIIRLFKMRLELVDKRKEILKISGSTFGSKTDRQKKTKKTRID